MRAGWNDDERNAPTLARMVEDAGAAAVAVHGRTAAQSYSGSADWDLVARDRRDARRFPVFGSGDCIEPEQIVERLRSGVDGVLVGRGVLRNPWILAQAADLAAGRPAAADHARGSRPVPARLHRAAAARARRTKPAPSPTIAGSSTRCARSASWYTKGLDNGSHLRTAINTTDSLPSLRETIGTFFLAGQPASL